MEKKGFTVALCISATGEKLPAFIIFKEKGGKLGSCVSRSLVIPDNTRVLASENGWMTKAELHKWLQVVWKDSDERRLLVLDRYKPHLTADTKSLAESLDTDLVFVPGGCTGIAQPLDVVINAPFKASVQEQWIRWRKTPEARTPQGKMKIPSRQNVINWASAAWDSISVDMIVRSFLRCGISNAVDGSEDDKIRDDIPTDIEVDTDTVDDENPDDDIDELDFFSDEDGC